MPSLTVAAAIANDPTNDGAERERAGVGPREH